MSTSDEASDAPSPHATESGIDASAEGGCGPVDTVNNCSACGLACSTTTGVPSCNGARCNYACNSNHQDCNVATAPDSDGCESTGTACCGTGCQTIHSSGLPSPANYYDCNSKGNSTQTQAMAACTGTGGSGCTAKNTTWGGLLGFGRTATDAACGNVAGTCYCWVYSGQNPGEVHAGGNGCSISCSSGSAWD